MRTSPPGGVPADRLSGSASSVLRPLATELLTADGQRRAPAFVDEGCGDRQELMARPAATSHGERGLVLVLGGNASPTFLAAASDAGIHAMRLDDGQWRACQVAHTPLLVLLHGEGRVVDKAVSPYAAAFARRAGLVVPGSASSDPVGE